MISLKVKLCSMKTDVERLTGPDDPKGFIWFANIGVQPRNVLYKHSGLHEIVPCAQEPRLP